MDGAGISTTKREYLDNSHLGQSASKEPVFFHGLGAGTNTFGTFCLDGASVFC